MKRSLCRSSRTAEYCRLRGWAIQRSLSCLKPGRKQTKKLSNKAWSENPRPQHRQQLGECFLVCGSLVSLASCLHNPRHSQWAISMLSSFHHNIVIENVLSLQGVRVGHFGQYGYCQPICRCASALEGMWASSQRHVARKILPSEAELPHFVCLLLQWFQEILHMWSILNIVRITHKCTDLFYWRCSLTHTLFARASSENIWRASLKSVR